MKVRSVCTTARMYGPMYVRACMCVMIVCYILRYVLYHIKGIRSVGLDALSSKRALALFSTRSSAHNVLYYHGANPTIDERNKK